MPNYNVWRFDKDRWVIELDAINLPDQDPSKPQPLTYQDARRVLEYMRIGSRRQEQWQVRELLEDHTPGEVVGYNVWCSGEGRWTKNDRQDPKNPRPLTYQQAQSMMSSITEHLRPEIKEIGADLLPQSAFTPPGYMVEEKPATPTQSPVEASPEPTIDFDVYNGFRPNPNKYQMSMTEKDPYTGLIKPK